jgi:hypothetical protein
MVVEKTFQAEAILVLNRVLKCFVKICNFLKGHLFFEESKTTQRPREMSEAIHPSVS